MKITFAVFDKPRSGRRAATPIPFIIPTFTLIRTDADSVTRRVYREAHCERRLIIVKRGAIFPLPPQAVEEARRLVSKSVAELWMQGYLPNKDKGAIVDLEYWKGEAL